MRSFTWCAPSPTQRTWCAKRSRRSPGVEGAFVFGSVARGEAREESDVDVLLLGEEIPRRELGRTLLEASALLGRDVNAVRYTRAEFADEAARGESFARRVARGPKRWIAGDERLLGRAA